ncbi:tetratricopeptide repeat protein [Deinococcus radiophilus]|uniref:Tetratricopeptide repeat protein n=1 Tax=Deinococcus radiophilus TaxID=32062 RepID=A0A431W5X6_9DEIO|nr:tetratricopeptide repeat protein [Deinococcus radiophilus]
MAQQGAPYTGSTVSNFSLKRTPGLALAALGLLSTGYFFPAAAQSSATGPVPMTQQAAPISASSYVTVGQFYYGQGNFQRALVAYGAAVRANPTNPDALLGLGRTQTRLGQSSAAAATLTRLLELDPANISAHVALSQAYSLAFRQDRLPQSGEIRLGQPAGGDANLRSALATLDAAERALSGLPTARRGTEASKIWNERGYILRFQGDLRGAIRAFQEASRLNPTESVILFNLAETQYAGGDLTAAIATIQRAVLAQPRDALNRAYFARLLAEGGNFAVARPQAAMAVQLAPTSAYAAGQYGVVSYLAREPLTARVQLERALELSGGSYPDFSYYLGRLNLDAGDLTRARSNFGDAASTGQSADAYYFLGLSLERSGTGTAAQPQQAAQAYRQALNLQADHPEAAEGLARLQP